MSTKPRRRWFRFSLRTLLVVVTILCGWLAWETSIVRQRRAALQEIKAKPVYSITTAEAWAQRYPPGSPGTGRAPPVQISRVRRWLGDEAIQEIAYGWYPAPTEGDLARWRKCFPEADIYALPTEPCHPGCFPRGTLVETPSGRRAIDTVQTGDLVTVVDGQGALQAAKVRSVFVTENRLWQIDTDAGTLLTTQTQPLCVAWGRHVAAGELKAGDGILYHHGPAIQEVKVLAVAETSRVERVFNLVLGDNQTFVASGFLARSKPPALSAGQE
jgi:hypothetical protein